MSKRVRVTWTETITFSTDVFVPDDREGDQTEREYALRAVAVTEDTVGRRSEVAPVAHRSCRPLIVQQVNEDRNCMPADLHEAVGSGAPARPIRLSANRR